MEKADLMKTIGRNIRRYRIEAGVTQEKLSEKVGMGASFVARLENGQKMTSVLGLYKISCALDISLDALVCKDTIQSHHNNIELLLSGQTENFLIGVEKIIKVCISEFK